MIVLNRARKLNDHAGDCPKKINDLHTKDENKMHMACMHENSQTYVRLRYMLLKWQARLPWKEGSRPVV